jgi:hypothetical protein
LGRPLFTHAERDDDRYIMDEQNQNDELYPIAVLIDELKVRISIGKAGRWCSGLAARSPY